VCLSLYVLYTHKYNLDPRVIDLRKELAKLPSEHEREIFKKHYLADTLISSEVRVLAWMYRDVFNEDYKLKA